MAGQDKGRTAPDATSQGWLHNKRHPAPGINSGMMRPMEPLRCGNRRGIEAEENLEALARAPLAELSAEVVRFWEVHESAPAGTAIARQAHWANIRELYAQIRKALYGSVDLSRVDQDTEAQLYACVVLEYFSPHPLAEPGVVVSPPLYSPQQAGLRVFFERELACDLDPAGRAALPAGRGSLAMDHDRKGRARLPALPRLYKPALARTRWQGMSEANKVLEDMIQLHATLMKMLMPLQERKDADVPAANEDKLREFLWSALREADALLDDLLMPRSLDLNQEDPATARWIEELAVWRFFSPHPSGDPWEILLPAFTPEQGDLKVFYMHGRWFCTWLKLEDGNTSPEQGARELRVLSREKDSRIVFVEV